MKNNYTHIMLADNDEADRKFFNEAINNISEEISINIVSDGFELMQYLKNPKSTLPDLIFLDLNIPLKNGVECLKEIKKNDKLKNITIAVYSTSASEVEIEETFVKGANIYINLLSDFNNLCKVIKRIIGNNTQYNLSGISKDNFILRL
jgi:CheY-like chemotaxis protein